MSTEKKTTSKYSNTKISDPPLSTTWLFRKLVFIVYQRVEASSLKEDYF